MPFTDYVNVMPKVLIGMDHAKFLWGSSQRYGKDDEPCAVKSLLGCVISGQSAPNLKIAVINQVVKADYALSVLR